MGIQYFYYQHTIFVLLSIEDKDPNIPNPIGKTISVELTGGGNE